MSVVNSLEKTYLSILRIVVLTLASILLLVTLFAGISGALGIFDFGNNVADIQKVTPDQVIQNMAVTEKSNAAPAKDEPQKQEVKTPDPYQKEYESIAVAFVNFVKTYGGGVESVEKEKVVEFVSQKASLYEDEEIKKLYIIGLVESVEKALKSETVIARVKKEVKAVKTEPKIKKTQIAEESAAEELPPMEELPPIEEEKPFKESPIEVGSEVIMKYTSNFNANLEQANAETARLGLEKIANKAASMIKLYIAAAAFFIFLLVVFMSILIKIERNIRVIAEKD